MAEENKQFPGEAYYNKTALTLYTLGIGVLLWRLQPKADLFELAIETVFMVVWTYFAGGVIFIVLKAVTHVFFTGSELDDFPQLSRWATQT